MTVNRVDVYRVQFRKDAKVGIPLCLIPFVAQMVVQVFLPTGELWVTFIAWPLAFLTWAPFIRSLVLAEKSTTEQRRQAWFNALEKWDEYDRMGCYSGLCPHGESGECVKVNELTSANRLN